MSSPAQLKETLAKVEVLADLEAVVHREELPSRLGDRVDAETRARLERLRRGQHPEPDAHS